MGVETDPTVLVPAWRLGSGTWTGLVRGRETYVLRSRSSSGDPQWRGAGALAPGKDLRVGRQAASVVDTAVPSLSPCGWAQWWCGRSQFR